MVVSGFVVYEILSEWKISKRIILTVPDFFNSFLHTSGSFSGTVKAIILFILLPIAFYMVFVLLKRTIGKESWLKSFTQLVMALLPISASMHLLKALLKTTSRIPYWEFVFSDPKGVETAQMLQDNPGLLNKEMISGLSPFISAIAIGLSIGGILLSIMIIRKQNFANRASGIISVVTVLIYASLFLITLVAWRLL
jgi:hypothetical protein